MSVKADIRASITGYYQRAADLGTAKFDLPIENILQLNPGTGAKQADRLFTGARTIAASANDDIDLAGALADPFGATLTFAKVCAIFIRAAATNANDLVVGGHPTAAFMGPFADASDKIILKPGAMYLQADATAAGWAVTAATADTLRIANGGAGSVVKYDLVIIGRSA